MGDLRKLLRMRSALALSSVLALFGCVLVASSSDVALVEAIVPETDVATPNEALVESMVESDQALSRVSPIAAAIVALKAYCTKAKGRVESTGASDKLQGVSSLIQLIKAFGDEAKPEADLVSDFADVVLKLRSEGGGLYDYFMKNINDSVLKGKSPVSTFINDEGSYLVTFNSDVVGLSDLPEIFKVQLAVPQSKWSYLDSILTTRVASTWDPVSEKWHLSRVDSKRAFDKAYLQLENKWALDKQLAQQMAQARAHVAITSAYESGKKSGAGEVEALHPLPVAGVTEASDYYSKNPNHKDVAAMKKAAKAAAAKAMMQTQAIANTEGGVLKHIENMRAAIHVRVTTGAQWKDVSAQQPRIEIIREKGSVKGTIETLPLRGESWDQDFLEGKELGAFQGVRLKADQTEKGKDGWLAANMEVQDGYGKPLVPMMPVTCSGDTYAQVWLNKDGPQKGDINTGAAEWTFIAKGTDVPPCVSFIQKPVQETCRTTCGYSGDTFYGPVPCVEKVSGKTTTDGVCRFWEHVKPARLSLTCPPTPPCVQWKTTPASTSCTTTCGYSGTTNFGTSFCQEVDSGSTVSDGKCTFTGYGSSNLGGKPAVPQVVCPPTRPCVQWGSVQPGGCPGCGYGGGYVYGRNYCHETVSGKSVAASKCTDQGHQQPGTPSSYCGATSPCPRPSGTCCVWLSGYSNSCFGPTRICSGGNSHYVWVGKCDTSRACD